MRGAEGARSESAVAAQAGRRGSGRPRPGGAGAGGAGAGGPAFPGHVARGRRSTRPFGIMEAKLRAAGAV